MSSYIITLELQVNARNDYNALKKLLPLVTRKTGFKCGPIVKMEQDKGLGMRIDIPVSRTNDKKASIEQAIKNIENFNIKHLGKA